MEQEKIGLIVNNAAYDRVSNALSIANVLAAQLRDVHVFFTYGAIIRLRTGKADELGKETENWMLELIKIGLEKDTIPRISEMLSFSKGFGVKIYACSAAKKFHDIPEEELKITDGVIGISEFLEKVQGASTILYI